MTVSLLIGLHAAIGGMLLYPGTPIRVDQSPTSISRYSSTIFNNSKTNMPNVFKLQ